MRFPIGIWKIISIAYLKLISPAKADKGYRRGSETGWC